MGLLMQLVDLLVRVVDKKGVAAIDASQRGDIIAGKPAGIEWSNNELGFDDWRIIRSRVPQTFVETVMMPVMNRKAWQRRAWCVDLDRLPNPGLYRGPRTRQIIDVDSDHLLRTTYKKVAA